MIVTGLLLVLGLVVLWTGTTSFIVGTFHLGRHFKLPEFVIGLSAVACSSFLPKFIFCMVAIEKNQTELMIGSLLGNNLVNLTLILGLAALTGTAIYQNQLRKNLLLCLATFLFFAVILLIRSTPQLPPSSGALLLIGFIVYLGFLLKNNKTVIPMITDQIKPFWKTLLLFCLGLTVIPIASLLVINKALQVSQSATLSITIMGLFPIALGFALPEFATLFFAFKQKKESIIFRSLTGSVITNTLGLFGISSLLKPMTVPSYFYTEIGGLILVTLLSCLFLSFSERATLSKIQSTLLIFLYVLYAYSLLYRVF